MGIDAGDQALPAATVGLVELAFDAGAPAAQARFWAQALGWDVVAGGGDDVELVPTDGTRFRLRFRPGAGEKLGQNRIHFDLTTSSLDDQRDTVAGLLA